MYLFWIMLVFLSLYIVMVVKSSDIWNRLFGINLLAIKVVIIIIIIASYYKTAYILDIAIASTLLSFVCIIFSAHFLGERKKRGKRA